MHPRKVAEKTAKAVLDINSASTALADKFKLEIADLPDVRKFDADLGRAMHLEHLAKTLTDLAVASKAMKIEKAEEKKEEPAPVIEDDAELIESDKGQKSKAKVKK